MMAIIKEVCIEGVCRSGKTTLGKRLASSQTIYLAEYSQIDNEGSRRNKMVFPPKSRALALTAFKSFFALDLKRRETYKDLSVSCAVTDRGLLAILAFEYAMLLGGYRNVFLSSADYIRHYLSINNAMLPTGWIYMRFGSFDEFQARVDKQNVGLPFLLERNTAKYLQEYYDQVFASFGDRVLWLDATDHLEENYYLARSFLDNILTCPLIPRDEFVETIRSSNIVLQGR